jgi:hypothetical protein
MKINLLTSVFALVATTSFASVNLDFNAQVPGTLNDANGLGTGFTTRLPGTGSALPANDPNMDLLGAPGKLLLTSTHADTNQFPGPTGNNLDIFEGPGVFVAGVRSSDVIVKATFENVSVPNGSDHLMVYAGVNANLLISAGIHELNVYMLSRNQGTGDVNTISTFNSFATGDDIEITLSRTSNLWTLTWSNLTTSTSGTLPSVSFPAMDGQDNLYFGVLASNAGTVPGTDVIQSFVAQIDDFSVTIVPEPTSAFSCIGLIAALCLVRRH